MKTILLVGALLGSAVAIPRTATSAFEPPMTLHRWGVRAEYVTQHKTYGRVDTEIVLQNTSAKYAFKVRNVIVLGRGGTQNILRVSTLYSGATITALATLVIPVADLGVAPGVHGVVSPKDPSMIVVETDDRGGGHVRCTAVVKQWEPSDSNDGHFAMRVEESFFITPL